MLPLRFGDVEEAFITHLAVVVVDHGMGREFVWTGVNEDTAPSCVDQETTTSTRVNDSTDNKTIRHAPEEKYFRPFRRTVPGK